MINGWEIWCNLALEHSSDSKQHNLTCLFEADNVFLFCNLAQDLKSEHALQGLSSSSVRCEGIFNSYLELLDLITRWDYVAT